MSEEVEHHDALLHATHRKGNTLEDTVKAYDDWAHRYEEDVNPSNYMGSTTASNTVTNYYRLAERKDIKILDLGAGTGTIGEYLGKNHFKNIDALEPSEKMLEKLKEKNIYDKIWNDSIGYHQTDIPNDYYDCVVSSGAFGEGHIPVSSVYEIVRITKPGGIIVIAIREENLTISPEYSKLEPTFDELEKENKITKVSRTVFKRFWYYLNGVCFVYKVV